MRSVTKADVEGFYKQMVIFLDEKDRELFIGAYNQLLSDGLYRIEFADDADNTPMIFRRLVLTLESIKIQRDKTITIHSPTFPIQVVGRNKEPQHYNRQNLTVIQNSTPTFQWQFVNEDDKPINITNLSTILASLSRGDPEKVKKLTRIFVEGGYKVEVKESKR